MMSDRVRRLAVPLLALLLGLGVLGGTLLLLGTRPEGGAGPSGIGGAYRLVDHTGRTVTEGDFQGRPHLVFFGFTHCPDVCPTTLFQISEVLNAAGPRGRDLRALFITVDPERDTPEVMKSYISSFDERIVGLTGDRAAVDGAIKAFRAFSRKVPTKEGDYTMEHTSTVYLMDKRGAFVGSFPLSRAPEEAAKDLVRQL
jgi:protein SCO1/2